MFVCFLALWRFFLRDVVQWKRTRLTRFELNSP